MKVKIAVVPLSLTAAEKFGEAVYFYNRMVESVNSVREFPYHLSAFLSALGSTIFYLQTHCSASGQFATWYAKVQDELMADATLIRLNNLRAEAVYSNPVNLVVNSGPKMQGNLTASDGSEFNSTIDHDGRIVWRFNNGGHHADDDSMTDWKFEADGESVLGFCRDCLSKIDHVLGDWHDVQKQSETTGDLK
ncbi:MAG: hypothetical protein ABJF23_33680 [Bryobacteraceae bacterium]